MAIYVFDIDGTLADIEHRKGLLETKPKQWNKFFELASKDEPIEPMISLMMQLADNNRSEFYPNQIILATGRPERTREATKEWLWNTIGDTDIVAIYMRPDNDRRPDHIIKVEQAKAITEQFGDISIWFDDRAPVINALRDIGVFVVDVNQFQNIQE